MISNAKIISLKAQTGATGLGEPVHSDELTDFPLLCELITPKSYRAETDRQRGIKNDAMIWVNRSMFDALGHSLAVGDRITIRPHGLGSDSIEYDATDINPRGNGSVIEISLAVRDDQAGGA